MSLCIHLAMHQCVYQFNLVFVSCLCFSLVSLEDEELGESSETGMFSF